MRLFLCEGLKKKLKAISLTKNCAEVKPWISSIINHLYWSVISTDPGEQELIVAKWKSVVNHIQNNHQGFGIPFQACIHGTLSGRELQKPWLAPCKLLQ